MLKDFYLNHTKNHHKKDTPVPSTKATYLGETDAELAAQRIYDYVSNKWFMYASPVLSNDPMESLKKTRGSDSCFLTYVPDTLEGLIDHSSELRWTSVYGGVGGHWSDVRTVSDIYPAQYHFYIP